MGAETMMMNSINRGVICPVYLFYGAEPFLINQVLDSLYQSLVPAGIGDFNYQKMDGGQVSPAQVVDAAGTMPAFADKRLVIVKEAPWFGSGKGKKKIDQETAEGETAEGETEPLLRYLLDPSPYTCLVLVAGEKINAQRKLVKAIQKTGQVLEFPTLKGSELNHWIEERFRSLGKKVEGRAVEFMAVAAGNSLSLLAGEIEKLVLYAGNGEKITMADAVKVASSSTTLSIFDLMDAVGGRKAAEAVRLLREMTKTGEPEAKIFYQLAGHLRTMLRAKTLHSKGCRELDLARELSVHPFVAKKALQQGRNFSPAELAGDLEILLQADVDMKTGMGEGRSLLETVVMRMCSRDTHSDR